MYYATPKQHLKLNSWNGWATLRGWVEKKSVAYKKKHVFQLLFIYTLESKDNYNTHITTIIPVVSFLKTLFSPISFE